MGYSCRSFAALNCEAVDCQKRLIKTFINSVFVYDDKVILTFDYSGDNRTITLKEIDAGLQQGVRLPRSVFHNNTQIRILRRLAMGSDLLFL